MPKPGSQPANRRVMRFREGDVDFCQPPLAKPHHEDACDGGGDDYAGFGAHGQPFLRAVL